MGAASYTFQHHGTWWFQIRVPRAAQARYGRRIQLCLQTRELREAKVLALKLESDVFGSDVFGFGYPIKVSFMG